MKYKLTNKDYISILKYYKLSIPKTKNEIKRKAKNKITNKICRCMKKFKNTQKGIGVCTRSVVNSKGFTLKKIKCVGKTKKIIMARRNLTQKL